VTALVLTLRTPPKSRVDLSAVTPAGLAGLDAAAIERLDCGGTRLGDLFAVRLGDPNKIVIEGGSTWLFGVARGMAGGILTVVGDAGDFAAAALRGGLVVVRGQVGERAADRMRRGMLIVEGDAGPAAASRMIAGTVIVCGWAAAGIGTLMRRGTVVAERLAAPLQNTFVPAGGGPEVFAELLGRQVRPVSPRAAELCAAPADRFSGDMAVLGKGEVLVRR
jgi:formylmethanofuran dehydrogenase subunit C